MTREPTAKQLKRTHDQRNKEAAEIILADPRYQGIMREWATAFLNRLECESVDEDYPLLARAVRAA